MRVSHSKKGVSESSVMEQSEQEQQDSIKRMRDERAVECSEDESEKARCEINRNDVVAGYPIALNLQSGA